MIRRCLSLIERYQHVESTYCNFNHAVMSAQLSCDYYERLELILMRTDPEGVEREYYRRRVAQMLRCGEPVTVYYALRATLLIMNATLSAVFLCLRTLFVPDPDVGCVMHALGCVTDVAFLRWIRGTVSVQSELKRATGYACTHKECVEVFKR